MISLMNNGWVNWARSVGSSGLTSSRYRCVHMSLPMKKPDQPGESHTSRVQVRQGLSRMHEMSVATPPMGPFEHGSDDLGTALMGPSASSRDGAFLVADVGALMRAWGL